MSDATAAEFDTMAEWTAQVATDLGPEFHVPAGCRGSGSPAALEWLLDTMALAPGALLLDCGAGVGGPAAFAAMSRAVSPVLVEPQAGACRAAKRLFDHPVVRGVGTALPMAESSFDAAWSLGVLCTTAAQRTLLTELRRVVRPGAPIGLLIFVAQHKIAPEFIEDNHFPTEDEITELLGRASLVVERRLSTADLPAIPDIWNERVQRVTDELDVRYGHTHAWQLADRQSARIGALLKDGSLQGDLLVVR